MRGEGYACEGPWQGRGFLRPRCPALNPVNADCLYPVAGYCAANRHSGRLMIPSIEEYETFCATDRYGDCPWSVNLEGPSQPGKRPMNCAPLSQAGDGSSESTKHSVL